MERVEREVVVEAPADTVYQIWRNLENMPQIMSNIEEVRLTGEGRSHWKAKGPFGRDAEWDAMITEDDPGHTIAWCSVDSPDANVRTEGAVHFESFGDATRVRVALGYESGGASEAIAKVFSNPAKQVEDDLLRFKEEVETGGQYRRATERVTEGNVSKQEQEAEKRRDPANGATRGEDTTADPVSQVQGKNPGNVEHEHVTPEGAGQPEPGTVRSATTSTPGGALGSPTEADLKRDQTATSDPADNRLE